MTADTTPSRIPASLRALWLLIQAGILLYGLGAMGYLLARFAVGERWPWVALANNFVPWWALGGLVAAGVGLLARRRWLLVTVQVPILIAFLVWYGPLLLPKDSVAQAGNGTHLTVATFNTLSFYSDPEQVRDVIADLDADVIGLQEVGPEHTALFERDLADQYPYQALYPELPVSGVALLSRYPILEEEVFRPLKWQSMMHLRAVLDVDGTRVTFYVAHPSPPYHVASPLHYDSWRRDTEIDILRQDYLVHERGPLLVVGDFNMTDQSNPYRDMDALLDDTFREVGWGLGFTFPDPSRFNLSVTPLLIRIDYVWHDEHFTALDVSVGESSGGSDHRPVVAELVLKP
jgi:vancomycin resistance protein VanJ